MSKINDLIKELCLNGVTYQTIGSVCHFQNGFAFKSNLFKDDGELLLRITNIDGKKINLSDAKYINISDYNTDLSSFKVNYDDIVIAMSGATTGKIGINRTNKILYLNQRVGKLTPRDASLNNHFLYHYLLSKANYFYQLAGGGAQPNLSSDAIKNTTIPIPPIEVQEEIVRILDKFSELEAELDAELDARKNQYEFWRAKLLNNKKYITKTLGEIATFSQGIQVDPKEQYSICSDGMVPFLRIVDFVKNNEPPRFIKKPDNRYIKEENTEMVMIRYGASAAGKVFINKFGAIANNMFKINIKDKSIDIKYLWHFLSQDSIYQKLNNTSGGSTMPAINFKLAASIKIIIPPLEEQIRIVNILDKFDKLVNDVFEGLPAETELRKQQYKYYKNKLLNFEELA